MANPFPFSSGDVLTAANLNAIGEWTAFTPTFNNVSLGASGASAGKYAQINDVVFWQAYFDLNSTGSISGHINMSLPVGTSPATMSYETGTIGWCQPIGSGIFNIMGYTATNQIYFYSYYTSSVPGHAGIAQVNATAPATWNSSGRFFATGWYELA